MAKTSGAEIPLVSVLSRPPRVRQSAAVARPAMSAQWPLRIQCGACPLAEFVRKRRNVKRKRKKQSEGQLFWSALSRIAAQRLSIQLVSNGPFLSGFVFVCFIDPMDPSRDCRLSICADICRLSMQCADCAVLARPAGPAWSGPRRLCCAADSDAPTTAHRSACRSLICGR